MVWVRFCLLILGVFAVDLFLLVFIPAVRRVLDPFFLTLVFLGLRRSMRGVWLWGAGLGLLKDLTGGAFFGLMPLTFALSGSILSENRHLVEQEDLLIVGIWTGILTLLKEVVYAGLLFLILGGGALPLFWWVWIFLSALVHGVAAGYSFPVLSRLLQKNRSWAFGRM